MENMLQQWKSQLQERSGNLTTNEVMPQKLVDKLLDEDESLKDTISFEDVAFPKLEGNLGKIQGLEILAGIQKTNKKGCLSLFRAMRFPTYKRMHELLHEHGYAVSNYEQERILDLYRNAEYIQKREEIKSDPLFWTQPQERVVHGLPLFCLANDALQIHRAYRGETDKVVLIVIHIPYELLESGKIKLIANTAIDLDYHNEERDFEIREFWREGDKFEIDYEALRARGIDLHEMYSQDLPLNLEEAKKIGIEQDFFFLDIYKITGQEEINNLMHDVETLKKNKYFLHGFFGDQNIFGRRRTKYLPYKCQNLNKK